MSARKQASKQSEPETKRRRVRNRESGWSSSNGESTEPQQRQSQQQQQQRPVPIVTSLPVVNPDGGDQIAPISPPPSRKVTIASRHVSDQPLQHIGKPTRSYLQGRLLYI